MRAVPDLYPALAQMMAVSPRLGLALASAWLDPLSHLDEAVLEEVTGGMVEEPEDLALLALSIARDCLPETYVKMLLSDGSVGSMEALFCTGLAERWPQLQVESLYELPYGAPLRFHGLDLLDEDFPEIYPAAAAALSALAGGPGMMDETTLSTLTDLLPGLIDTFPAGYEAIRAALEFLFSATGNTLLDLTEEEYWDYGYDALEWAPEALDLVASVTEEAEGLLALADRGFDQLMEPGIADVMKRNMAALMAAERREDAHLHWPGPGPDAERGAGADAELLQLRHPAA